MPAVRLRDLPVEPPPEQVVGRLTRRGVRIVSLNPKHETLEDYFLGRVHAEAAPAANERA